MAFESSNLRIGFNFSKLPGNPQTTLIEATFTNLSPSVYADFIFQAAVPKVTWLTKILSFTVLLYFSFPGGFHCHVQLVCELNSWLST